MPLRVRLVKKHSQFLNGVDLKNLRVGECAIFPDAVALMLMAEGWAQLPETAANPRAEDRGEES